VAPAAFDNQIVVIEVETGKIVKRIVTGLNPIAAYVHTNGKDVYISNATDKHVSKMDLETFIIKNIHTKDGPNGITITSYYPKMKPQNLTLGVPLPLSGIDGPKGRDMMRGYEFWKLWIKDQPYKIKIIYLDTQSDIANVDSLTRELIEKYKINILLSTSGLLAYNIESKISSENHIPITPAQANDNPWLPNEIAAGEDYFVTTKDFDQLFYSQYNFKASTYSASATALGVALQQALLETNSLDYEALAKIFTHNQFKVFYQY
jgi:hypothetical protein